MIPFLHRVSSEAMEENPLWLVVLADMMTNLMLFFLVLFSVTQQGKAAQQQLERVFDADRAVNPERDPRMEAAIQEFREDKAAERLKKLFSDVSVSEKDIRVRLREALLFPSGSADLSSESRDVLGFLAQVLKQMPNEVIVEGYTDPVPVGGARFRDNWDLSVARADAVIESLQERGIAPERFAASGYGPYRPLASNADPAGRLQNRRVEIVIVRARK